ncbi:NAD(P)-binding protein [Cryphonectria parasitica EP155]|uniref:NAD(P)-binding protein n=1 Tax=Cryphonectria parasitica (strain ATCC 38755 / EP155) TaxID=660469 RepID=A0A9P5CNW6_CRYP1|nr:NAD(P)-binding protein [Cryphonectria parasitica EP155]KAF3764762.1 NAD(P)-binding protein [Cryphonectria parasitica EP155]
MFNPEINFHPTFTTPSRPLTWLITGCSSGLGLALARQVQASGHTVIATSRNPSRTPELVEEITKGASAGSPGRWITLDVDDPHAGKVIADLEAEGVAIDVLCNNAGYSIHHTVEQFTEDEIRAQFETVFFGPYRLMRAVLPGMRRRRFGVVVNMSTGASLEGRDSMGIYAASKAAMDGLTKVLAKEVAAFNIRTHTILLGAFRTDMGNRARVGSATLAEDYKGSLVDQTLQFMTTGKFVGDGDPKKAARAIYQLVAGEGLGAGKEAELLMPLGRDMEARVQLCRNRLDHCWEVFGDIAMNVRADS